jgi:UDP-galactopyranose mutase
MNDYFLIIGAGISGSVFAERIANKLKKDVIIIEKRNHIGGNCFDFVDKNRILVPLYGPHFFHTNDKKIFDYISRFTDWVKYEHRVLSFIEGKLIPIPVSIKTINLLFNLNLKTEKEMKKFLSKQTLNIKNPKNFEELAIKTFGRKIYELLFKNYTIKQWRKDPKLLDLSILKRLPIRYNFDDRYFTDTYQYMPKEGYTNIFKNMLNNKRIKLMLNTNFNKVDKSIIKNAKRIIFTGPIDKYYQYKFGRLEYRGLKFVFETKYKEYFQPVTQVNYPNNFKYTRITEPKHCYQYPHFKKTTIIKEYPTPTNYPKEKYYPMLTEENQEKYQKYKQIKNEKVIFVGRLAQYRYFNMDQAFKNALDMFNYYF